LTTITGLLTVVTSLTLSKERGLTSLVLGHLVRSMLTALEALAVGVTRLGNVHLKDGNSKKEHSMSNCNFETSILTFVDHFSLQPSIHPLIHPSVRLSVYPSIYPFIHPFVQPSRIVLLSRTMSNNRKLKEGTLKFVCLEFK
jgi:hypothetical protein